MVNEAQTHESTPNDGRLAPQDQHAVRDDSPLLGWESSPDEKRRSTCLSVPGGYPDGSHHDPDEEEADYVGRNSTDSDLYNFYSADSHSPGLGHSHHSSDLTNTLDMHALSALSDVLLDPNASLQSPDDAHGAQHGAGSPSRPDSPAQLNTQRTKLERRDMGPESLSGKELPETDPAMRYSFLSLERDGPKVATSGSSPDAFPSPSMGLAHSTSSSFRTPNESHLDGILLANEAGRSPSSLLQNKVPFSATSSPLLAGSTPTSMTHSMPLSRSNSAAASPRSIATASGTSSPSHSNSPSRSNSNSKSVTPFPQSQPSPSQHGHTPTPRQSQSHSPSSSPSHAYTQSCQSFASTTSLPYSQPIPRPHRSNRNDAVQQLHRGSSIAGGTSPPTAHFSRSSGSPPLPSHGVRPQSNTRRQSGLRSSIVSTDLQWENGADEDHVPDPNGRGDGEDHPDEADRPNVEYGGSDAQHGHSSSFGYEAAAGDDYNEAQFHHGTSAGLGISDVDAPRPSSPGPSVSSHSHSMMRPGSSFQASRPPSSYQDSGRGSAYGFHGDSFVHSPPMTADTSVAHSVVSSPEVGKRAPSLHSRPSRSNLHQQMPGYGTSASGSGIMRSPSNAGSLRLARSPSSGSLMTGKSMTHSASNRPIPQKPLSRTTSATALNAVSRSASGTNLNAYDSPEPPVPPLPPSARNFAEEVPAQPVGMATTTDVAINLSNRVNRSRASSTSQMGNPYVVPEDLLQSPLSPNGVSAGNSPSGAFNTSRTSWSNHLPAQALVAQKSSDWGPVQEHPEDESELSLGDISTDVDADVDEDEGDHTYNTSVGHTRAPEQKSRARPPPPSSALPEIPAGAENVKRYSLGSSVADEWETDESGKKYRRVLGGLQQPARIHGLEETDMSEMSDSDFDEAKKRRIVVEEERTAAIVLAEEGGGLIVNLTGMSVVGVDIKPGTTHVVMPSSTSPELVPSFLDSILPTICNTLLALDISGNSLAFLPPTLATCVVLEELNIGVNPLRSLPHWLAELANLRVLIADATGISIIPGELARLNGLRTLSVRRNRLHSLPSWLCLLTNMEWLLVDDNPFLEPWKHLLDPLFNPVPSTPMYPPNTPFSAISGDSSLTIDSNSPPVSAGPARMFGSRDETAMGDQTITLPPHGFPSASAAPTPVSAASSSMYHVYTPSINGFPTGNPNASSLTLASPPTNNTTPDTDYHPTIASYFPPNGRPSTVAGVMHRNRRTYADGDGADNLHVPPLPPPPSREQSQVYEFPQQGMPYTRGDGHVSESERKSLKKMKSADDVRKRSRAGSVTAAMAAAAAATSTIFKSSTQPEPVPPLPTTSPMPSPIPSPGPHSQRLQGQHHEPMPPKFMSTGRNGGSLTNSPAPQRPALTQSMWDGPPPPPPPPITEGAFTESPTDMAETSPRGQHYAGPPPSKSSQYVGGSTTDREDKGSRKWGFLKKMSMSKMKAGPGGAVPQEPVRTKPPKVPKRPSTANSANPSSEFGGGWKQNSPNSAAFGDERYGAGMLAPSLKSQSGDGTLGAPSTVRSGRRRSFLPLDAPPVLNIPIDKSPLLPPMTLGGFGAPDSPDTLPTSSTPNSNPTSARQSQHIQEISIQVEQEAPAAVMSSEVNTHYAVALRTVMAYLRDMLDLGGAAGSVVAVSSVSVTSAMSPSAPTSNNSSPLPERMRRPTLNGGDPHVDSMFSNSFAPPGRLLRGMPSSASLRGGPAVSMMTSDSGGSGSGNQEERRTKDDKAKRNHLVKEIVETERTYVKQLQELIDIYIQPSAQLVNSITNKSETVVPASERRIVFNGLEALYHFHMKNFLPALEKEAAILMTTRQPGEMDGELSARVARGVADVFVSHAAFMKMYSTYINNFDNCLQRLKQWTVPPVQPPPVATPQNSSTSHVVGLGLTMSAMGAVIPAEPPSSVSQLTNSQRKRIKGFLKRCRHNPRHSQLNLEGYLLLPVQRIPRYRLLLEQLAASTPPRPDSYDDPIEKAVEEISSLATNMNEGKRESESRRKLVSWQSRIKGKFPSPLVQPHRRLIMDGVLKLSRVVRKDAKFYQVTNAEGESVVMQVECLAPENTPRQLIAILCNDLLVLCKDPSRGTDPNVQVELWAVLRMQTLPQPASIVHGHTLRLVDHKAIMYFEMMSTSDALTWSRAINMNIPANRS
ncbi:hypothetical protein FRB99_008844 [Tulasnella sp. 403]|nr:hypothetical protein FRB99_008844 [Tulasnella sp. 403]